MRRSLRGRLQVWYALVLLLVVGGFAGILYWEVRAARYREIDAHLAAAAQYLDVNLRRFPPYELDGRPPPPELPPRPPPERGKDRPPGPPPKGPPPGGPLRPTRERLLADLALPEGADPPAYFGVWRADGGTLKTNALPDGAVPPDLADTPPPDRPVLRQRGEFREAAALGPRATRVLVGRSVRAEEDELRAFAWRLAGAGGVVLAVGLVGGWLVSARIFRPVAAIAATASAITATNLSERIDPESVDRELADLARVLNAAFDRLEAAFERQAQFTADASHELRTPLAIIRSHAQLALARPRAAEEYRHALTACLQATDRMTALVDGLLTLARADAGRLDLRRDPVDLRQLTEETVGLIRPLAEERGIAVRVKLAPATVAGDADRLGRVITNLLSNAVQYNRPGGTVRVRLIAADGRVTLAVQDTGPGIPEADRPHLFERFYRVDRSRGRTSGGTGLGLAICKSIVEAHGGAIGFTTEEERGSTFWVRLPAGR